MPALIGILLAIAALVATGWGVWLVGVGFVMLGDTLASGIGGGAQSPLAGWGLGGALGGGVGGFIVARKRQGRALGTPSVALLWIGLLVVLFAFPSGSSKPASERSPSGASRQPIPQEARPPTASSSQDKNVVGRTLISPVRGNASLEITRPDTKLVGSDVITTIRARNLARSSIAGLKVEETWRRGTEMIAGGTYRHAVPLQAAEAIVITLSIPRDRVIGATNQYLFSHANGAITLKILPNETETSSGAAAPTPPIQAPKPEPRQPEPQPQTTSGRTPPISASATSRLRIAENADETKGQAALRREAETREADRLAAVKAANEAKAQAERLAAELTAAAQAQAERLAAEQKAAAEARAQADRLAAEQKAQKEAAARVQLVPQPSQQRGIAGTQTLPGRQPRETGVDPQAAATRFFRSIAGRWTRRQEGSGRESREVTEEELTIDSSCRGSFKRTLIAQSRGFAGWSDDRKDVTDFSFQCDASGRVAGQVTGGLVLQRTNTLLFNGNEFRRR